MIENRTTHPRAPAALFIPLVVLLLAGCAGQTPKQENSAGQPVAEHPQRPREEPERIELPRLAKFSTARPGSALPGGWRPWTLSRFKKPTGYQLVSRDGATVVRADAEGSASGLVHAVSVDPREYPRLRWRWKVNQLIEGADNRRRDAEDSPVRLIVVFEGDKSKWEFSDRIFATQMKMMTGYDLPYATLMYIWENRAKVGELIANQHTSRIRMVVAESGAEKTGRWWEESRNVLEDYRRAFGEEPGRIVSIAVMTDTDNTGGRAYAYYGDIVFERER